MTTEHEHGEHGEHQVQPLLTVADFDGDGAVNWSDLTDLFSRYGSKTGEEKYHFLYDLNVDGQIDQKDLVLAASSIGG
jgi:Ca2+-binding EF-hand superfamily protein